MESARSIMAFPPSAVDSVSVLRIRRTRGGGRERRPGREGNREPESKERGEER